MTDLVAGKTARPSRALQSAALALLALLFSDGTKAADETMQMSDAVRSLEPSESVKAINEARGFRRNATAATDSGLAKSLFEKCASQKGNGTILEPEEQPGYVYGISSEIFEKFDEDCDAALDDGERAKYFAAQHAALQKKLEQDLRELEYQLSRKTARSSAASNDRGPLDEKGAERVAPAILTDTVALSISGAASSPPGVDKKSGKVEMKMATTPIKSFRTAYPTSLALDWTASVGREEARTSTERTRTDDVTFTPLSYTLMSPDKNWAFKLGIGGSYVWTDKRTHATGAVEKEDALTLAYVTSLEYKLPNNPCFKIKVDYELKQRHFFSEKVSSKLQPGVTWDFMCVGRQKRKATHSGSAPAAAP
jgi:hypothetical protein